MGLGALLQAEGQTCAPADLPESAAASAQVTGWLHAGTHTLAAEDHAGSRSTS